ncbi:hypothetical protein B0H63DRAFT_448137 [Podospora didyma]|uniref:Mitochondrial carrier protein pet8 n=1 Tax=Podospora didyma TaxID=330526 RepID=A0AAE0NTK9_9PEZI|nr:hypothetical protein B0H63DRAFT_448137 [Podospora didyma]
MSARALVSFLPAATAASFTARRTLATSARFQLKESSSLFTKDDPSPEAAHKHKQDSLDKQKKGQGHWKPELASDSEESVKADRSTTGSGPDAMKKLQDRTKAAAEETSKHGTSMRDGL